MRPGLLFQLLDHPFLDLPDNQLDMLIQSHFAINDDIKRPGREIQNRGLVGWRAHPATPGFHQPDPKYRRLPRLLSRIPLLRNSCWK